VSEIPFGFGKSNDDENDGDRSGANPTNNPFGFGGDIGEALHRFADLMSWQGGPVNWDLAKDVARQAAAGGDRSVVQSERAGVEDAIRLFHERPYRVLGSSRFAEACVERVTDPWLRSLPLVGGIDQLVDSTDALERPSMFRRALALYSPDA